MPDTPTRKADDREPKRDRKITFYLTDDERRAFLVKRAAAGYDDNSGFIADTLGVAEAASTDEVAA